MQNQENTRNVLDTDRIGPLLFKLATPAFFGMFVQTLYSVVNTIFIGHTAGGDNAIAGLSICFPVQMLLMGVGMMIGMGGTSLISRSIGAGENQKAERVLGNGITCVVILSLVVTAIILPNINGFLRLIGASEEVLPYARKYLIIIVSGTVVNLVGLVFLNYIRAEGNARVPMVANIMGAGLNIMFDWIFIIRLNLSVTGAAMGTVIAQTIVFIFLSYFYLSKNSYLKFSWANLRPDKTVLKPLFTIGVSSFVQTAAGSISALILIGRVEIYGGDIYLSAFGIIQRIMMFATMPAMVIGQGVQPILGFNYGARRHAATIKAFKLAAIWSTLFSSAAFLLLLLVPGSIVKIFSSDPALVAAGSHASRLAFWSTADYGLRHARHQLFYFARQSHAGFYHRPGTARPFHDSLCLCLIQFFRD